MKFRILAAAAALALSAGAQAAVFTDNFDSDAVGTDKTPVGWYLSANTDDVDIIGSGFFDFLPGNGNYIDLAGSNGLPGAGVLATNIGVVAGTTYTATFELAGNQRDSTSDSVTVLFGGAMLVVPLSPTAGFSTYSIATTASSGSMTLSFQDSRDGNVGALLDDVSVNVSAVPEPGNVVLMITGIAALAFTARRRRG
jgi:hypothetical protein